MKLLNRVRDVGLRRRLAASTIACYQSWISEFLRFSRSGGTWRRPGELFAADVERYLNHLARDRRVSASTQNQAVCAIVFLYKQVLAGELAPDHLGRFEAERARRPVRVPTVLSAQEVQRILNAMPPGSMRRVVVEEDLGRLRDDTRLHQYIAEELERVTGSRSNAGEQLQRRLSDL